MTLQEMLNLAVQHQQAGRLAEAEAGYRRILAAKPDATIAMYNLAMICNLRQRWDDAIALCRRMLAIQPDSIEGRQVLATSLYCAAKYDEAETVLRKALAIRPDNALTHVHLGNVFFRRGHYQPAADFFRKAVQLQARDALAQVNLAAAVSKLGEWEQSIAASRAAIALRPDFPPAHNMLGFSLYNQAKYAAAMDEYQRALALDSRFALAHWNVGSLLLLQGQYAEAWPHYQWRWMLPELGLREPIRGVPMWDGGDIAGKRILLTAEQGLGDTLQFIRYVPELAQRGAKISAVCPPQLLRLLSRMPGIEQLLYIGQTPPPADVQCTIPTLPALFKTTVATIPAPRAYLSAEPEMREAWRKRAEPFAGRKIGLVWAGRPEHFNDRQRSIPLAMLAPLAEVANAAFFSLQIGPASGQAKRAPMPLTDWTDELSDFAYTAALVENLDLVITVDTAVAHLAGALGKPTWVLLPLVPDWRWMLDREDSPWYPSVRLFRQKVAGDWQSVVAEVMNVLKEV